MTRIEYLLVQLAEECSEVAQRCSKAVRFGLTEIQSGQALNNAERIAEELAHVSAIYRLLGVIPPIKKKQVEHKMAQVKQLLLDLGLSDNPPSTIPTQSVSKNTQNFRTVTYGQSLVETLEPWEDEYSPEIDY